MTTDPTPETLDEFKARLGRELIKEKQEHDLCSEVFRFMDRMGIPYEKPKFFAIEVQVPGMDRWRMYTAADNEDDEQTARAVAMTYIRRSLRRDSSRRRVAKDIDVQVTDVLDAASLDSIIEKFNAQVKAVRAKLVEPTDAVARLDAYKARCSQLYRLAEYEDGVQQTRIRVVAEFDELLQALIDSGNL